MSVARYVARVMERIAPLSLAEKWDNVRLPLLAAVYISLTIIFLTTKVVNEALALPASVIIAYHPTIFKPLPSLTLSNPLQASLLRCAAAGVSVYCPHTSLDSVYGGIDDWLAQGLGAGKVNLIGAEAEGGLGGLGRVVKLDEKVTMASLQERIKQYLGLSYRESTYSEPTREVQSVAICAGSGGSVLDGVDADVYFTGEMSHHEVLATIAAGKNVILCGHTNTERGYLPILASKLRNEFASAEVGDCSLAEQLTVIVSTADRHPLDIV
ncbi:NGG1 interacting factor 3-like protein [Artomyces pyxidatus]|uniref:NGG1 interacting factor 3-like protein n=1 Tax=Artomyces pyxidatus TaxID=48021 RepID=A0ACB8SSD7_9AGAM|nr:NGG1 interacting factor 3-like protein [Artomyces pyxidatus]